ncbi:MAG: J domain-containing protein [Parcubacteria group bacterium]
MIYLAALAVLVLLVWAGRGGLRSLSRGGVRVAGGVLSILMLSAAGIIALRGDWIVGLVLLVMSLGGMFAARVRPSPPRTSGMSAEAARSILGVGPDATREEIDAAYKRLMRMAHPDKGGTSGLAAQLNAARDRLSRK